MISYDSNCHSIIDLGYVRLCQSENCLQHSGYY